MKLESFIIYSSCVLSCYKRDLLISLSLTIFDVKIMQFSLNFAFENTHQRLAVDLLV